MAGKFPEAGQQAVLDLSHWSGPVSQYIRDQQRMEQADTKAAKSTALLNRLEQQHAQALGKAADAARQSSGATSLLTRLSKEQATVHARNVDLLKRVGQGLKQATGATDAHARSITGAVRGVAQLARGLNFLPAPIQSAIQGAAGLTEGLGSLVTKATVTIAIVAALAAAFVALGMRGAAMPGMLEAFEATSAQAGVLSQTLLTDLRDAARGTVADMELIRNANLALAGASPQVARALGDGGLAGLMQIARAQARATGQDVTYLFDSLVRGVKRGSPLLIDNTGLVIKEGLANEAMAASLGKTVAQLTAEEQQLALLNATLEAGRVAVESYGQGALHASDYIARIQTTITNTLDKLALAVQPAFTTLLQVVDTILQALVWPLQNIVIPLFYELTNAIFGPLSQAWQWLSDTIGSVVGPALQTLHRWILVGVGIIRALGQAFGWLIEQAGRIFGPFINLIRTLIVEPILRFLDPVAFAERAGNVIGALAEGMLWAANTFVLPAVTAIATLIADFLMGFSPPKRGPLADIMQGAGNVMQAWMQGFVGVPLTPIEQVAADVDAALGGIGNLTYQQVQARIAQLDNQIQPYLDQLAIVKARAQEIADPLDKAKDALEKRLAKTVALFSQGKASAAEVRALDLQRDALYSQLNAWEDISSEAEYQLSMAQARQAVERSLLGIQANRVKGEEEVATAIERTVGATEKKGTGGGESQIEAAMGGNLDLGDVEGGVEDFLGVSQEEVDQLFADMGSAFTQGMERPGLKAQLGLFEQNRAALTTQIGRITSSEPFQNLTSTFSRVFGEGGDLSNAWNTFRGWIETGWDNLFGENGLLNLSTWPGRIQGIWDGLFNPDTGLLSISAWVNRLTELFTVTLPGLFSNFSLDNLIGVFAQAFGGGYTPTPHQLVAGGVDELNQGIPGMINSLRDTVRSVFDFAIPDIFQNFNLDGLWNTFLNLFGLGEGGLIRQAINGIVEFVRGIFANGSGGGFFDALAQVGRILQTLLLAPVELVINGIVDLFVGMANRLIGAANDLIWNFNEITPDSVGDIGLIKRLDPAAYHIDLTPSAEKGAFLGAGLARVHRDEVLVGASQPYMTFPARWVAAMETLADRAEKMPYSPLSSGGPVIIVQPAPVVTDSGTGLSINNSFNGTNETAMLRELAELAALRA